MSSVERIGNTIQVLITPEEYSALCQEMHTHEELYANLKQKGSHLSKKDKDALDSLVKSLLSSTTQSLESHRTYTVQNLQERLVMARQKIIETTDAFFRDRNTYEKNKQQLSNTFIDHENNIKDLNFDDFQKIDYSQEITNFFDKSITSFCNKNTTTKKFCVSVKEASDSIISYFKRINGETDATKPYPATFEEINRCLQESDDEGVDKGDGVD